MVVLAQKKPHNLKKLVQKFLHLKIFQSSESQVFGMMTIALKKNSSIKDYFKFSHAR